MYIFQLELGTYIFWNSIGTIHFDVVGNSEIFSKDYCVNSYMI